MCGRLEKTGGNKMITESEESFIERVCGISGLTSKDIQDVGAIVTIPIKDRKGIEEEKCFFFFIRFMKEIPLRGSCIYYYMDDCETDKAILQDFIQSRNGDQI